MRLGLVFVLLASLSCSHLPTTGGGSLDDAQRIADDFLHQLRWSNLRAASSSVRGARRKEFQALVDEKKFDDHLKVTEYEVKEVEREPNGLNAVVTGELTWYVEPSVTLTKEKFHIHLAWLSGSWLISWIEGGPLPLPETPLEPEPDAGAALPAR